MRSVGFLGEGVEIFDDGFIFQRREIVVQDSRGAFAEAIDLLVGDLRLGLKFCEFLFGVNRRQFLDVRLVTRRSADVPASKSLRQIVVGGLSVDYFMYSEGDTIHFPGWLGVLHEAAPYRVCRTRRRGPAEGTPSPSGL